MWKNCAGDETHNVLELKSISRNTFTFRKTWMLLNKRKRYRRSNGPDRTDMRNNRHMDNPYVIVDKSELDYNKKYPVEINFIGNDRGWQLVND